MTFEPKIPGIVLVTIFSCTLFLGEAASQTPPQTQKPNIIIFEPDDLDPVTMQEALSLGLMPNTQKYIIGPGTTFNNYYVSDSHGCPTRESYFFGKYFHNMLGPNPKSTVCSAYQAGGVTPLATWLKAAGYQTSLLGKYSDGYGYEDLNGDGVVNKADAEYVPPDWDNWFAIPYYQAQLQGQVHGLGSLIAADNPNEYDYWLNQNGTLSYHANAPSDYQADVLSVGAVTYLNNYVAGANKNKPLFMLVATGAPHVETNYNPDPLPGYANIYSYTVRPAPRYENTVTAALPEPPSFNDPNVSDKPEYIAEKPLMNEADIEGMTTQWQNRLEALRAVDDLIGKVVTTLTANGMTNNVFMFFSDNGWMYGFDRLGGKLAPYDPSIGTPLYVSVGGGVTSNAMIIDNDICATIVDLAGATPTYTLDGTSLKPLLSSPATPWRNRYLAQYYDDHLGEYDITPYEAVRTSPIGTTYPNQMFAEYSTKELELYDYTVDPYALNNLNNNAAYNSEKLALSQSIQQLLTCAGSTCHTIEFQ